MDPIQIKLTILEKDGDQMKVEFDLPMSSSVATVFLALENIGNSISQMVEEHMANRPGFGTEDELREYFEKIKFSDIS